MTNRQETKTASPDASAGQAAGAEHRLAPSPWVCRFLSGIRAGGSVLDVATGRGRHARLLLEYGFSVTAVDRDLSGVEDLRGRAGAELVSADLEDGGPFPLAGRTFDAVIVTNYLWRPLFPALVAAVAPGGLLIYETFAAGNERFGRPARADFLLQPGELIDAVRPHLTPIAYEQVTLSGPTRIVARIVAAGAEHPWLAEPPALAPTF